MNTENNNIIHTATLTKYENEYDTHDPRSFRNRIIAIILAVIIAAFAIVSATHLSEHYSDPESYPAAIESLDDKRNNVLAMSASSAAISTALTLLPNDIASPIADNLADLSTTLMIVLAAIFLEKYLLTLAGLLTFKFLIPLACILGLVFLATRRQGFLIASLKMALFGLCLVLLVPLSTQATNFIEDTYAVSIQENVNEANATAELIQEKEEKDSAGLATFFKNAKDSAANLYEKLKEISGNFIEAAAILIITSCVIPILTLWLLLWAVNTIIGFNIQIPNAKVSAFARSGSRIRRRALAKKNAN